MQAEMREMAALAEAEGRSQHFYVQQAMASTSAELQALEAQAQARRAAKQPVAPASAAPAARLEPEAAAVAILQQQVTNVRRVVSESSQKEQQIGILRTRVEILQSENTEEKENTQRAQQREVEMAAEVDEERRAAEEAREQAEVIQQEADRVETDLRDELKRARSEVSRLSLTGEQLQTDLDASEIAGAEEGKLAAAKLIRSQHNHKAELAKLAKDEKARKMQAAAASDKRDAEQAGSVAAATARLKDEQLDELRAAQKDFDERLRVARDEFALPIKQAEAKQEDAERRMSEARLEGERRVFAAEKLSGESLMREEQKHSVELTALRGEADTRVLAAMAEAEAKVTEAVRLADETMSEALSRAEHRRRDLETSHDERIQELTGQFTEASRQAYEGEVASHQRTSQSWADAARKAREERDSQIALHDQSLADAARISAVNGIAAHVRVRAEEATATAAQIERLEKDKTSAQLQIASAQKQIEHVSEQLRTEVDRTARESSVAADLAAKMKREKEMAEDKAAALTRQLEEAAEISAKLRENLVYGTAGDSMAESEMGRLHAERNNLQKQVELLKARLDSTAGRTAESGKRQQDATAKLQDRVAGLEDELSQQGTSRPVAMSSTKRPDPQAQQKVEALQMELAESRDQVRTVSSKMQHDMEALQQEHSESREKARGLSSKMQQDVAALQSELDESRDQMRALSSKKAGAEDTIRRIKSESEDTIRRMKSESKVLAAQLESAGGPSGSMSDAEREALLEGKRLAEESIDAMNERHRQRDNHRMSVVWSAASRILYHLMGNAWAGWIWKTTESKRLKNLAKRALLRTERHEMARATLPWLAASRAKQAARAVSSKDDEQDKFLKRQQTTIADLEAQLESAGSMSDAEREGLLEAKRLLEESIGVINERHREERDARRMAVVLSSVRRMRYHLMGNAWAGWHWKTTKQRRLKNLARRAILRTEHHEIARVTLPWLAASRAKQALDLVKSREEERVLEVRVLSETESLQLKLAGSRDEVRTVSAKMQQNAEASELALAESRGQVRAQSSKIQAQQQEVEALQMELAESRDQVRTVSSKMQHDMEALQQEHSESREKARGLSSKMQQDVAALQSELDESRDQMRALSSKKAGAEDTIRRIHIESKVLAAQLDSVGGPSGSMSDAEREALLEGKRLAEESIGRLEKQLARETEALQLQLAEARDQVLALSSKMQQAADASELSLAESREEVRALSSKTQQDAEMVQLELAEAHDEVRTLSSQMQAVRQDSDAVQQELSESRDQVRSVSGKLKQDTEALQQELADARHSEQSQQLQLAGARDSASRSQSELEDFRRSAASQLAQVQHDADQQELAGADAVSRLEAKISKFRRSAASELAQVQHEADQQELAGADAVSRLEATISALEKEVEREHADAKTKSAQLETKCNEEANVEKERRIRNVMNKVVQRLRNMALSCCLRGWQATARRVAHVRHIGKKAMLRIKNLAIAKGFSAIVLLARKMKRARAMMLRWHLRLVMTFFTKWTHSNELEKLRAVPSSLPAAVEATNAALGRASFEGSSISSIDSGSQGDAENSELTLEVAALKDRLSTSDEKRAHAVKAHEQTKEEKNALHAVVKKHDTTLIQQCFSVWTVHTLKRKLDSSPPQTTTPVGGAEVEQLRSQLDRTNEELARVERRDQSSVFTMMDSRHDGTPAKDTGTRDESALELEALELRAILAAGQLDGTKERYINHSHLSESEHSRLQQEICSLKDQLNQSNSMATTLREQLTVGLGDGELSPTSRISLELEVHELRARLAAGQLDKMKGRYINHSQQGDTNATIAHECVLHNEIERLSMQLESSKVMCRELQTRLSRGDSADSEEKAMLQQLAQTRQHELQRALEERESVQQLAQTMQLELQRAQEELRRTQSHLEMASLGRDDAVQHLQAQLASTDREMMHGRSTIEKLRGNLDREMVHGRATIEELRGQLASEATHEEELHRLQQQVLAAEAELSQLPMVKATIADFQRTAEATHNQLVETQRRLADGEYEHGRVSEELGRE